MRPIKQKQSAVRTPLNRILGAEANVRLLRVACAEPFPMTRNALGKAAGLEPKGALLAANRLIAEGILQLEGKGARQLVALRSEHPMAGPLRTLFAAETNRIDTLVTDLRKALSELSDMVDAAWLEGSFARHEDKPGEPIRLGVLSTSQSVSDATTKLQGLVEAAESRADVTIDVVGYTRPDLAAAAATELRELNDAIPLVGLSPLSYTSEGREYLGDHDTNEHSDRERSQHAYADLIAERVVRDPFIVESARRYVRERLAVASDQERHALMEWNSILRSMSPTRLSHFLRDPGERATRLRQTSPFLRVISKAERDAILKSIDVERERE